MLIFSPVWRDATAYTSVTILLYYTFRLLSRVKEETYSVGQQGTTTSR